MHVNYRNWAFELLLEMIKIVFVSLLYDSIISHAIAESSIILAK